MHLFQLVTSKEVVDLKAKLLEIKAEAICMLQSFQRVDAPHDTRNVLGWYQEDGYVENMASWPQNESRLNDLTVWVPLVNINE